MFLVITGGSGSGKSAYAEARVVELAGGKEGADAWPLYYIATMFPFDGESHRRIARHREMRKEKHFTTIERYTDLKGAELPQRGVALLECMSNLTANEMFREDGAGEKAVEEILAGVERLRGQCAHLAVVTNEIFSDGMEYDEETRRYQRYLGAINREMAKRADEVWEVVCGIPLAVKRS